MLSASISVRSKAKINLFLHVTGKRPDGYHMLESLVAFPDFAHDVVCLSSAEGFSFGITGPFAQELEAQQSGRENLVTMAHELLQNFAGRKLPCCISLEKNLPIGSGMGGGSSNAATTVRLMENYFDLALTDDIRNHILVMLGADVAICYGAKTSYFSGIGDVISTAPALPPLYILLAWPGVHCSTQAVFEHRTSKDTATIPRPASFGTPSDFIDFIKSTHNDLEEPAIKLHPVIGDLRLWMQQQPGCHIARMSGSGSTIFGLFTKEDDCKKALANIPDKSWWAKAGKIGD
jgi:4-diphosphocytidyl-2-C-methyl-D-erythritol kinase